MKVRGNTSIDPFIQRQLDNIKNIQKQLNRLQEMEKTARPTGVIDTTGVMICEGHIVTTWSNTKYKVGFDGDEPVLVGVKPLSYVNKVPTIVGFTDESYKQ